MLSPSLLATLAEMLTYCRPHGSIAEGIFRRLYLLSLPDALEDECQNIHVKIGTSPILWSSHTDTVHRAQGRQTLRINSKEHTIRLSRRSKRSSNCLGADDTVGVFLMREMILRGIPGHYVFHYGEEAGGIGSSGIRRARPELFNAALYAIAFDRRGTADVITHQSFGRCASDTFARSLAAQLPGYSPSDRGIFTDTANYDDLIPECTNISVGYYHEHSRGEYVDYAHVGRLLEALCTLDPSLLICERDPSVIETYTTYDELYRYPSSSPSSSRRIWDRYDASPDPRWLDQWCHTCEAPIFDPQCDEDEDDSEWCQCRIVGEDDVPDPLSDEDAQFLRYLRGL